MHKTLILYGLPAARETAQGLLENMPEVMQISQDRDNRFSLLLKSPLHEGILIDLLAQSGISGFRLLP